MTAHNIAGEWRGHYAYRSSPDNGCSFSAFFSETSGKLEGTIVDDDFPGKASLIGSFSFPSVQFTKTYSKSGQTHRIEQQANQTVVYLETYGDPIEYDGLMSEDGKSMNGTWTIVNEDGSTAGTWTAYRLNEEEELDSTERVKERQLDEVS